VPIDIPPKVFTERFRSRRCAMACGHCGVMLETIQADELHQFL
jgi:hypothetical protein